MAGSFTRRGGDVAETRDHEKIKKWVEERGGRPARVKGTGGEKDPGLLRITFPGGAEQSLEPISWEEFFQKFDEKRLAFSYQEKMKSGEESRYFKLVSAD